ncbi:MAG: hypothetical protein K5986_12770, partial [Clostridium sp.]|nr:hypothetical protein [Clostridium sp.]
SICPLALPSYLIVANNALAFELSSYRDGDAGFFQPAGSANMLGEQKTDRLFPISFSIANQSYLVIQY